MTREQVQICSRCSRKIAISPTVSTRKFQMARSNLLPWHHFSLIFVIRLTVILYCIVMVIIEGLALVTPTIASLWGVYETEVCMGIFGVAGVVHAKELHRFLREEKCCLACHCIFCCCRKTKARVAADRKASRLRSNAGSFRKIWFHIRDDDSPYGRKGKYYSIRLIIFEMYEIPSQTYLAYEVSRLSTNWNVIALAALTVIISCWGYIVIELTGWKGNRLAFASRLIYLDLICDVIVAMLIPPICLVGPLSIVASDLQQVFNPKVFTEFMAAGQIATITSPYDLFLRAYPLYYVYRGLRNVEKNSRDLRKLELLRRQFGEKTIQKHTTTDPEGDQAVKRFHNFKRLILLPFVTIWAIGLSSATLITTFATPCGDFPLTESCTVTSYPLSLDFQPCSCVRFKYSCLEAQEQGNWSVEQSHNFFQQFGDSYYSQNLRIVTMRECTLSSFPESILRREELVSLSISDTELDYLEFPTQTDTRLNALWVARVTFKNFPSRLPRSLTLIRMFNNNLSEPIPFFMNKDDLPKLTTIFLDSNPAITTIPSSIFQYPKLEILVLRNNSIQVIPSEIQQLKNLRFFFLSQNNITTIPEEITRMESLRQMDFAGNQITSVPWTRDQILTLTTNPDDLLPGNILFRHLSLSLNPICNPDAELQIFNTTACEVPCAVGCPRIRSDTPTCDFFCNTAACNFSNGHC